MLHAAGRVVAAPATRGVQPSRRSASIDTSPEGSFGIALMFGLAAMVEFGGQVQRSSVGSDPAVCRIDQGATIAAA
jgi:hypothetical protein